MAGREDRKAELIAELAGVRRRADRSFTAIGESLDVPARVRRSVSRNMFAWLGGAALLGVVIAKLRRPARKVYVDNAGKRVKPPGGGVMAGTARLAFEALRPLLLKIAMERLQPVIERMVQPRRDE